MSNAGARRRRADQRTASTERGARRRCQVEPVGGGGGLTSAAAHSLELARSPCAASVRSSHLPRAWALAQHRGASQENEEQRASRVGAGPHLDSGLDSSIGGEMSRRAGQEECSGRAQGSATPLPGASWPGVPGTLHSLTRHPHKYHNLQEMVESVRSDGGWRDNGPRQQGTLTPG